MNNKTTTLKSIASEGIEFLTTKINGLKAELLIAKTMKAEIRLELDIEGFESEIELLKNTSRNIDNKH